MALEGAEPLRGWKAIAKYLDCSVSTAQRLEKENGLPVRRSAARGVHAYESELDTWLKTSDHSATRAIETEGSQSPGELGEGLASSDHLLREFNSIREPKPTVEAPETEAWLPSRPLTGAATWLRLRVALIAGLAVLVILIKAILAPAYAVATLAFCLGAGVIGLSYSRLVDTPGARAAVGAYMTAGMAYIASGTTMPSFETAVINIGTIPPATAYLFVVGLKFVPLFVLVLAFWVVAGYYREPGASERPGLDQLYTLLGLLFLTTEFLLLGVTSGWGGIFRAGLPGRWTLVMGSSVVLAVNIYVWLTGRQYLLRNSVPSYRPLFLRCAVAYFGLAVAAFFVDDAHNRINRYYLDVHWPDTYMAGNPNGIEYFRRSYQGAFGTKVGPDLAALLSDPAFLDALRNGKFYKQHFDEPFQLRDRAVIYAYRPKPQSLSGHPAFVAIRFPKELADALRFVPTAEE